MGQSDLSLGKEELVRVNHMELSFSKNPSGYGAENSYTFWLPSIPRIQGAAARTRPSLKLLHTTGVPSGIGAPTPSSFRRSQKRDFNLFPECDAFTSFTQATGRSFIPGTCEYLRLCPMSLEQ